MGLTLIGRAAALYVGKKAVAQTLSKTEEKFAAKLVVARKDPVAWEVGKGIKINMTPGAEAGDVLILIGSAQSNVSVPATVQEDGQYDIHWHKATGKGAKDILKEINAKENIKTGFDYVVAIAKKSIPQDSKKPEPDADSTLVNVD